MRHEVIDFSNLDKIFEHNLKLEEKTKINEILLSNRFNNIEKRYILFIANFLKENTYIDEKLETNFLINFLDFILDEKIFNELDLFIVDLLYNICVSINEVNYKVKLRESNIEKLIIKCNSVLTNEMLEVNDIGRLKLKINTITKVSSRIIKVNSKLDNRKYYKLLSEILAANINVNNYYFIVELFNIDNLNEERRKIILNYLLNNKINTHNNYILDILNNDAVLKINVDKYKGLVKTLFTLDEKEINIYYSILSSKYLSLNRKIILLDYLKIMLDKVKNNYSLDKVIREELNIFNVVFSNYFKSLNDDEFKYYLDEIISSNKPMSYIKVLTDTSLDDEKKNYALSLINEGEVIKNDNKAIDYKENVSLAAISPLLKTLDINEYKRILSIINKCSNSFYSLEKERYKDKNKLIDDRIILNDIAKGICMMLYKKELYINNMDRLYYTIDILLGINKSYYNEVISFATNTKSLYYTDIEYKRILKLIKRAYNNDRLYDYYISSCSLYTDGDYIKRNKTISSLNSKEGSKLIVDLFTNDYLMVMEDKSMLFEAAENGDKGSIIKLINELNKQSNYDKNINSILSGVDENTYEIILPNIRRIRKYKI